MFCGPWWHTSTGTRLHIHTNGQNPVLSSPHLCGTAGQLMEEKSVRQQPKNADVWIMPIWTWLYSIYQRLCRNTDLLLSLQTLKLCHCLLYFSLVSLNLLNTEAVYFINKRHITDCAVLKMVYTSNDPRRRTAWKLSRGWSRGCAIDLTDQSLFTGLWSLAAYVEKGFRKSPVAAEGAVQALYTDLCSLLLISASG